MEPEEVHWLLGSARLTQTTGNSLISFYASLSFYSFLSIPHFLSLPLFYPSLAYLLSLHLLPFSPSPLPSFSPSSANLILLSLTAFFYCCQGINLVRESKISEDPNGTILPPLNPSSSASPLLSSFPLSLLSSSHLFSCSSPTLL